jgi:hypothetical protein
VSCPEYLQHEVLQILHAFQRGFRARKKGYEKNLEIVVNRAGLCGLRVTQMENHLFKAEQEASR